MEKRVDRIQRDGAAQGLGYTKKQMSFKEGEHREELVDSRPQDQKVRDFILQKKGSSNADQSL